VDYKPDKHLQFLSFMKTYHKPNILFALISVSLLATLLIKLTNVPGGFILPGIVLGGMMIIGMVLGCLLLASILRLLFKRASFLTLFFVTTTLAFSAFHYQLYSPTLTIIVPNGYRGSIHLVLSNLRNNVLTVDTNGIGYLNKWTFNKTYTRPVVLQSDGKNLDKNLVGFNPSTFFGKTKTCCVDGMEMESLGFDIAPDYTLGEKKAYSKAMTTLVNRKWVLFSKPD
jgi:hypothetical protein